MIEILHGEYTYEEAHKIATEKGLRIVSCWSEEQTMALAEFVKDGSLPTGEYWQNNGENPYDDDIGFFKVKFAEDGYIIGIGYKYRGAKCKVAMRRSDGFWWYS